MAEVAAIAANVVKGVGAFVSSRQQSAALKGQAREAQNAGAAQAGRIREQARKAIGAQLAGQASNGFMGGTGSALDAVLESQTNAVLDAMTVQREAATKAQALRYEAKMRRTEGWFALANGMLGAASSAAGMKDDWAQAQRGTTPAGSYGGDEITVTRGGSFGF